MATGTADGIPRSDDLLSGWIAAVAAHKFAGKSHGSANAKAEFVDGVPVRSHLTDTVTLKPGMPVMQAARELVSLLATIAKQYESGAGAFSIVLKLSGRDGGISSAEATHTLTLNLAESVDGARKRQ